MTNFGAGLSTAYNELIKSTKIQTTFCLFMSDGWHNTGSYNNEVNAFKAKNWPIYTIGFGDDADENTLRQIASNTGGNYYYAPAISLVGIYHLITGKVKKESFLGAFTGFISHLQTITHLSFIDKGIETIKFVVGWMGSEMDMILIAPDGTKITPEVAATDPDIEYYKGNTYIYYTVNNPMPGEWKAEIIGTDIPTPEQYTLTITGVSFLISNTPGFKSSYNLGETVNIALSLEETTGTQTIPITEALVSAKITKPDISFETLNLYDDGFHNDGLTNDGLYANDYNNTNLDGFYQIEITACGTYSQGTFTRQLQETIQVGILTPPPPQDFTPPTTPGTPTENFPDTDISMETYTVYWSPATDTESGIAYYEIQEKINQGNWETIGSPTGTNTIISNKQAGNTYYYRVRAMNTFNLYGSYSASSDGIRVVNQLWEVNPNVSYILTLGKARVEISPYTFIETITFTMSNLPIPTQQSFPKIALFLQDRAIEFLALNSNNQQIQPINNIRITLPYNDPNPSNEKEDLNYRIFRLNEALNRWEEVLTNQQIDAANDTISILLSSLSFYIPVSPSLAASTLADVHVYPNPCKGDNRVKFKNLTENAKIQIYTIAGQLVDEIEIKNNFSGTAEWDCCNSSGKKVASGIYIYLITNDKGKKTTGKISVIR